MKTAYHLALRTLRQKQVVKKTCSCNVWDACEVQILASLLFDRLLLSATWPDS